MPASAARRAPRPDEPSSAKETTGRAQINVAGEASNATPSPARTLQVRLDRDLRADAPDPAGEARWPLYASLTFWGGVSSLMWAAIIGCVWALLRHG
jgi:hypothetical protein